MRLFIAIDLPDEIKEELVFAQEFIGSKDAKIAWDSKKKLHLTLKFLGEISEDKIGKLTERLRTIKFESFSLELGKLGVFDSFETARVLFVDVKPLEELRKLGQKIDSETLDFYSRSYEFNSHITIGRVKQIKFKKELVEKLKKVNIKKGLRFNVDCFTLYKSILSNAGSSYEVVERFDLKN